MPITKFAIGGDQLLDCWVMTASASLTIPDSVVLSNGDVVISGYDYSQTYSRLYVIYVTFDGTVSWKVYQTVPTTTAVTSSSICCDGTTIVVGTGAGAANAPLLFAFNMNGTRKWIMEYAGGGANRMDFRKVHEYGGTWTAATSIQGVYGSWDQCVVRFTDAGALSTQFSLDSNDNPGRTQWGTACCTKGSYVYYTGYAQYFNTTTSSDMTIVKQPLAGGGATWKYAYRSSGAIPDEGYDIAVDSSDNVYVVGMAGLSPYTRTVLMKFNSAGTLQWQKFIYSNSAHIYPTTDGLEILDDQSINVVAATHIFNISPSGTVNWSKKFSATINSISVNGTHMSVVVNNVRVVRLRSTSIINFSAGGVTVTDGDLLYGDANMTADSYVYVVGTVSKSFSTQTTAYTFAAHSGTPTFTTFTQLT